MTAHGSKGREFENVYIINATRKSWEASRGGGNNITLPIYQYDGDIEDEKRLFYVAMTRAKKNLSISFSRTDNEGREHEASEFVEEIDSLYKKEEKMHVFEEKNIDKFASFMNFSKRSNSLFEPEYLRKLFFERGLNVTALNNYLDCPKKYLFKNLIRIPDVYSVSLSFGSTVHKALELFFKNSAKEARILPKDVLLQEFGKALEKAKMSEKDEEKYKERGNSILSEYYDEYSRHWTYQVKVEFDPKRDFELNSKEILGLTGKIDKIEYLDFDNSKEVNLIDYKTGKPFSEKAKEEKINYERQIIFYHLLLEKYDDGSIVVNKSILDFLQKNKKDHFEQYSFEVTKEHLAKLKEEINELAEDVLSMEFLKKGCQKKDCGWCQIGM